MKAPKKTSSLDFEENKSDLVNDALLDIFDFNKISNPGVKCLNGKISNEGLNFIVSLSSGETILHDLKQKKIVNLSKSMKAEAFEFLPKEMVAIANKKTIEILSLRNGKPVGRLSGHDSDIKNLQISFRKDFLMSVSEDVCLIFTLKDFTLKKKIHSRASNFIQGIFNKDGKSLFLALEDHTILCFSLPNCTQQSKFGFIDHPTVSFIECSLDSRTLFAGGNFNYIIVFDLTKFEEKASFSLPSGCFALQKMEVFSRNILSFLGENRLFYLVNYESSQILLTFNLDFNKTIYNYSISPTNQISIFLTSTGEILLYDLQKLLSKARNNEDKYREAGFPEELFTRKVLENPDFSTSKPQNSILFSSKNHSEKFQTLKKTKSLKTQEKINKNAKTQSQFFTKNLNFSELTPQKLRKFLEEFKRFPAKNRPIIWKILLFLPNNSKSFEGYDKKPLHPGVSHLENNFPNENRELYNNLQKMLSLLSYHCSLFAEIDFFPALIFPFVKILEENQILCFEVILSFLMNWAKDFFMDFPNPPINFLEKIEDLLKFHDFELYRHFSDLNLDFLNVIWPIFKANYTGILNKEDWLVFMDTIFAFSSQMALYPLFFISYLIYFRKALLNLSELKEFALFFNNQNAINIEKILSNTHKIYKSTPKDLIEQLSPLFNPLSTLEYPPFTFYPQISIDFHHKIREKISSEEKELLSRKKAISQLTFLSEELIEREKKYRKRQENLLRLENERRERLLQEENQRLMSKIDEERRFRNKRIDQLKVLETTISSSLRNQEKLREEELIFLQKEVDSRKMLEEHLLESKLEEEALLGLEFTMSQKINEIITMRNREERQRKIRQELDFKGKQESFVTKLTEERWKNEDLESNLRKELQKQQKLVELNEMEERNDDENMKYTLMLEDYEKEMKLMELEKERKLRQLAEDETLRNEKLLETFKYQEELTRKEDEKHLKTILNNEKQTLIEKSREIIERMREANKKQEEEIEDHRKKLREIASVQKRAEFEQKIYEIKKDNDLRLLEEEKKLQKMLMNLEEDERLNGELKEAIENKEVECRERDRFYQSLKESQEKMLKDEKVKFEEYRSNYRKEMDKMRKTNETMNTEKLIEYKEKSSSEFRSSFDPKESLYSYGDSNASKYSEEKTKKSLKGKKDEILIQDDLIGEYRESESGNWRDGQKRNGDYEAKYQYEGNYRKIKEGKDENLRRNDQESFKNEKNYVDFEKIQEMPQEVYKFTRDSYNKERKTPDEAKFEENFEKNEEYKEDLMYSPDVEEKKEDDHERKIRYKMEMEELAEENSQNEDSPEEMDRRKVDVNLDQPKYRSHSNTPDRYEVLDEEEDLFG